MKLPCSLIIAFITSLCVGCGTTDTALLDSGRSQAYIQGFHDGRHSGMREAGNSFEHFIRDETRFGSETDYREGWLAGEAEGKRLQAEATTIATLSAGAEAAGKIDREVEKSTDYDQIATDALKDVDTTSLRSLEDQDRSP